MERPQLLAGQQCVPWFLLMGTLWLLLAGNGMANKVSSALLIFVSNCGVAGDECVHWNVTCGAWCTVIHVL